MVTLNGCKNQKKGIKLIEPNNNLAKEYIESAEETLLTLKDIKSDSRMWLATTKYYCKYFLAYSILMKIGIKSEIHECTIKLCFILEELNIFPKGFSESLEKDKELRIDNQYYLKNKPVEINLDKLTKLLLEIKNISNLLTYDEIKKIREGLYA